MLKYILNSRNALQLNPAAEQGIGFKLLATFQLSFVTVGVAQLVERWIVVPVVVGSNPTTHPI